MEKLVAENLLDIKAVFLSPKEPFTWASGIKSPIYCDNRLTLSFPKVRKIIEKSLAAIVLEKYPNCEMIMGTATAGIAHAALVADILELPMGYVRSSNKSHGRQNKIEGQFLPHTKVVIIEDLISTGSSSIETAEALREKNIDVLGIVSIFTYNMQKSIDNLSQAKLTNHSCSNLDSLLDVALEKNYIEEQEKQLILDFRNNL